MKNLLKFSLVSFVLASVFFSCKDKSAESVGEVAGEVGTKYITEAGMANITWQGSKPTGTHKGTIGVSEGQLFVSDGKITSGNFIIDMNSITVSDLTGDEKSSLESHLKGTGAEGASDFFNVTKYPTGKFEITGVESSTENGTNALVKGNLTLLDKTKEVAIPATVTVSDSTISVVSSTFNINRTDWGINYKSKNIFKELGDKFINDEISLNIQLSGKPASSESK